MIARDPSAAPQDDKYVQDDKNKSG
jgi:hypothetical protein